MYEKLALQQFLGKILKKGSYNENGIIFLYEMVLFPGSDP